MAGIERIRIVDNQIGPGAWRFKFSEARYKAANDIYRSLLSLEEGDIITECSKDDVLARHDIEYGVDLKLTPPNGMALTVQEKILSTTYETVTVEYMDDPERGIKGDWFNLKVDLYFVAYSPKKEPEALTRWILLDWNQVKLYSNLEDGIPWELEFNKYDGAKASFKHAHFNSFPEECVLAKYLNGKLNLSSALSKAGYVSAQNTKITKYIKKGSEGRAVNQKLF